MSNDKIKTDTGHWWLPSKRAAGCGAVAAALILSAVPAPAVHSTTVTPAAGPVLHGSSRGDTVDSGKDADARPVYEIPGGCVSPESVAVYGGKYYTGGLCNGKIYRGDLTKKRAKIFVPSGPNPVLINGVEATSNRLVITNGPYGSVKVYNRFTGDRVARFSNGHEPGDANVNDVAIAPNGDAYFTEYYLSKIYRIPAAGIEQHRPGVQKLPLWRTLHGTAFHVQQGSANGIEVTPDGRFLIVAHYATGELFRIRIRDKQVTKISLHGRHLDGPDGIVLSDADVLYVVEAEAETIAEIRLRDHYDRGRIVSRTTSPRLKCPSGVAIAGDRLLISNLGYGCPFELPWTVASIPIP